MGVYGMTYDQFWRDDPWLAKAYRDAYIERRKAENHRDWLMGMYHYSAISTALDNAFRKRGQPAEKYLEEPFKIFPPTKAEIEAENRREKAKIEAVYRSMMIKQKAEKAAKAAKEKQQDNAKT